MAPKIFLTGGTGYIGGSVLHTIVTAHPEYDVTVLLRSVPANFAAWYPNVTIVRGDYDSFDVLADAASQADVVVHNGNSDHEPSLNALITGLLRRATPGFLIHLSGTGIVSDYQDETHLGQLNPKVWSDISDVDAIASLPDTALHRNTEKLLFAAMATHPDALRIAIMCPPDIYGRGLGPAKTASALVPILVQQSAALRGVPVYGAGANARGWVHVKDLMRLYLRVVEAAARGGEGATWGREGYYFAATQEVSQAQLAGAVAPLLARRGVVPAERTVQVPLDTLDGLVEMEGYPKIARYLFAGNSRTKAERAAKLFGYGPTQKGLLECVEEDVLAEIGGER